MGKAGGGSSDSSQRGMTLCYVIFIGILSKILSDKMSKLRVELIVFRMPSLFISIYISVCVSWALRHVVCLYVQLSGRRLFNATIVRSSRRLGNRESGRVVRT